MKTNHQLKDHHAAASRRELRVLEEDLRRAIVPLTKENILTERQVCELLGVTDRTLRKYREKRYIGCIKLSGRILFLKHLLYLDLEDLYYQEREKG